MCRNSVSRIQYNSWTIFILTIANLYNLMTKLKLSIARGYIINPLQITNNQKHSPTHHPIQSAFPRPQPYQLSTENFIMVVVEAFGRVAGCEHSTGAVFKYTIIPTKEDNPDKLFYNSTQERVIVDGRAVHHAPLLESLKTLLMLKILETYPFRTVVFFCRFLKSFITDFCIHGMVIYGPRLPAAGRPRLITKGEQNMFYDAPQTKLIVCSI